MKKRTMRSLAAILTIVMVLSLITPALAARPILGEESVQVEIPVGDSGSRAHTHAAVEIPAVDDDGQAELLASAGILLAAGDRESAYMEWSVGAGAVSYTVEYKKSDGSWTKIDNMLIREYPDHVMRADAVGLAAGTYQLRATPYNSSGQAMTALVTDNLTVLAHDRSGFAFEGGAVPGAYNKNGTLKSGARVIYITNATKDSVKLDVKTDKNGNSSSFSGLQNILTAYQKGYDDRPLAIRLIGNITDFATMMDGDILIKGNGASKRLSCGITFEGIGNDAVANGWGLRVANASLVEVRNLAFMNCDSGEGDDIGLQQNNDHCWVHNCDLFYGQAGSDADQVKGDGALDTKTSTYITHSYNHFWDNGKCNLQGMKSEEKDNFITYHHNWYDHSDSRHPRIRTCSVHTYNNYFDGNAKYGVGMTMGGSALVDSNYFRNCKYPMLISMQGSDIAEGKGTFSSEAGGVIKSYNNHVTGGKGYIKWASSGSASTEFDAYEASSRFETVPSSVKAKSGSTGYYATLDNKIQESYYFDVQPQTPADAMNTTMQWAGRVQGGSYKFDFDNSKDDASYSVNATLKSELTNYTTQFAPTIISVGGTVENQISGGGSTTTAVTGVTVSPTTLTLTAGTNATLTATVAPSNATNKNVTWSSNNTSVATVSSSGKVTAVSAGDATITVTTVDGGKTASCAVTVEAASGGNTGGGGGGSDGDTYILDGDDVFSGLVSNGMDTNTTPRPLYSFQTAGQTVLNNQGTGGVFTLYGTNATKIDYSKKTFNSAVHEYRVNFGGSMTANGNSSANAVYFHVTSATAGAAVKVYWVCGGDGRTMALLKNGTGDSLTSDFSGASTKNTQYTTTFTLTDTGAADYYLGGSGGSNYIFRVEVTGAELSGHQHDWVRDNAKSKDATCTEDGVDVMTCSSCDVTENFEVTALGHDLDGQDELTNSRGDKYKVCKRCGEQVITQENDNPPEEDEPVTPGTDFVLDCEKFVMGATTTNNDNKSCALDASELTAKAPQFSMTGTGTIYKRLANADTAFEGKTVEFFEMPRNPFAGFQFTITNGPAKVEIEWGGTSNKTGTDAQECKLCVHSATIDGTLVKNTADETVNTTIAKDPHTTTYSLPAGTYVVSAAEGTSYNPRLYTITVTEASATASRFVHNFTANGTNSSFYTISGNLATNKGTVTYDSKTLTQCLKLESATNISFTAARKGKLTLVFVETAPTIKLDGQTKTGSDGIIEIEGVTAGAHTLAKADTANLFYMVFEEEGSSTPTTVPVESVTLNKTSTTLTVGQNEILTATVAPDNATEKTVTWTSSAPTVASVSDAGMVTALSAGTATITAAAGGQSATCTVTVTAASGGGEGTKFVFEAKDEAKNSTALTAEASATKDSTHFAIGSKIKVEDDKEAVNWPESAGSYSSSRYLNVSGGVKSTENYLKVNLPSGAVSATFEIWWVQLGGDEYKSDKWSASNARNVAVANTYDTKLVYTEIAHPKDSVAGDNGRIIKYRPEYSTLTLTAESGHTLDAAYYVGSYGSGSRIYKVEVTVTMDGGSSTVDVESVSLNKNAITLTEGQNEILTATVLPEDATDKTVTWSSSAPTVASVSDAGMVTALSAGTATITAAAGGQSATCTVTVNAAGPEPTRYVLTGTDVITKLNALNKTVADSAHDGQTLYDPQNHSGTANEVFTGLGTDGFFTVYCGGFGSEHGTMVQYDPQTFTADSVAENYRVNFTGGAKVGFDSDGVYRNTADVIAFTLPAAAQIKVWFIGGGDSQRNMVALKGDGSTGAAGTVKVTKDAQGVDTLSVSDPGTYYLGALPSKNFIYRVEVTLTGEEPATVDKAGLNAAITAAGSAKDVPEVNTAAGNVLVGSKWVLQKDLTALETAITAANTVKAKAAATQAEVNDAAIAMSVATRQFQNAMRDGEKPIPTGLYIFESNKMKAKPQKGAHADNDGQNWSANGEELPYNDYFTAMVCNNTRVDASTKTWSDGYASEQRFNPNGKADKTKDSIRFTTDNDGAVVKIWWVQTKGDYVNNGTNTADTPVQVAVLNSSGAVAQGKVNGVDAALKSTWAHPEGNTVPCSDGRILKNKEYYDEFTLGAKGTYYVGGETTGVYIFRIEVLDGDFTPVLPTGVTLNKNATAMKEGGTETLTATVVNDATDKTVLWTSSNESVAKVNTTGVITAVAPGEATITAKTFRGNNITATCSVTVNAATVAVTGVSLDKTTAELLVGGSVTLHATVAPSDATNQNVTWTSSAPTVATVTNGVVTAVTAGTATITATTVDGNKTAGCTVTVTAPAAATPNVTFSFDGANAGKLMGTTAQMEYSLDGGTSWTDCAADETDLADVLDKITAEGDIKIRDKGNGTTTSQSAVQPIDITKATEPDTLRVTPCTTLAQNDGTVTGVSGAMEWREEHEGDWISFGTGDTVLSGLNPKIYCFRVKATGHVLASEPVHMTVEAYDAPKEDKPEAVFTATDTDKGTLSGLVKGQKYQVGSKAEVTVGDTTTVSLTGVEPCDITVYMPGDGVHTVDSDTQTITVTRGATPTATKVDCFTLKNNRGRIERVTADMQYRKEGASEWLVVTGTVIENLTPGTYYVRVKPAGTRLASADQTLEIGRFDGSAAKTPEVVFTATGPSSGTLTNVTDKLKYKIDDGDWQSTGTNSTIPLSAEDGLTGKSEYTIYVQDPGDDIYTYESQIQEITVTKPAAPTGLTGVKATTLANTDGSITGVTADMQYQADGATGWTNCTGTITGLTDGTYFVRVKAAGTRLASEPATVVVPKFEGTPEATPEATFTATGPDSGTLAIANAERAQYRKGLGTGSEEDWDNFSGTSVPLDNLTAGKIYVRRLGNGTTTTVSALQEITVTKAGAPTGVAAVKATTLANTDGKLTGVSDAMQYRKGATGTWTDIAQGKTEVTDLVPDTYYVRVKAAGTVLASAPSAAIVLERFDGTKEATPEAAFTATGPASGTLTIASAERAQYRIGAGEGSEDDWTTFPDTTVPLTAGLAAGKIYVRRLGNGTTTTVSDAQEITVTKADTPTGLAGVKPTTLANTDGSITGVSTAMQYSTTTAFTVATTKDCTGTTITDLAPGTYYVRVKASGTALASAYATVIVPAFEGTKEATPEATFTATGPDTGTLTIASAERIQFRISGDWDDIGGTTKVLDHVTAGKIYVKKLGNGTTTLESDIQEITVTKAATPTGIQGVKATTMANTDASITGVSTAMEYSTKADFSGDVHDCAGSTITGLKDGTYYVRVKAAGTALASANVTVVIGKYTGVPAATPEATFSFDGANAGKLMGTSAQMEYSLDRGETWTPCTAPSTDLSGANITAEGDIMIRDKGDQSVTIASEIQTIVITKPAGPSGLGSTGCTTDANNDGTITGVTTAMEYQKAGGTWAACPAGTITGLANGTYYVRYKATGHALASANVTVSVSGYQTPAMTGTVTVTGTPKFGQTLTAALTGSNAAGTEGTVHYEWTYVSADGQTTISIGEDKATYTIDPADFKSGVVPGGTIRCTVVTDDTDGSVTSEPTAAIEKADSQSAPTTPAGVKPTTKGGSDGKITGVTAAMQYRVGESGQWQDITGTELAGLEAGDYYVRFQESDTAQAGEAVKVTVPAGTREKAPTPTATFTATGVNTGRLTGVTVGMLYQINGGGWKTVTADPQELNGLSAGSVELYQPATAEDGVGALDSDIQILEVKKAAAPSGLTVTQPTAIGGKGSINMVAGTHQYSANNGNTWVNATGSDELSAGTYLVRVVAHDEYLTSDGYSYTIDVFAAQQEKTPTATFEARSNNSGVLKGVSAGMEYRIGETGEPIAITGDNMPVSGLTGECTIYVVKLGNGTDTVDSDAQEVAVRKAAAPTGLRVTQPNTIGGKGIIAMTAGVHEYSTDNGATWTTAAGNDALAVGTYLVRVKAAGDTLASTSASYPIEAFNAPKEDKPAATFTATSNNSGVLSIADGSMNGLRYRINDSEDWTAITTDTKELTGLAGACTVWVMKPGNGSTTLDSDAQEITVTKAPKPAAVQGVDPTTLANNDGKLTGVDATMEWKKGENGAWQKITAGAEVTGLSEGTYYVRVAAAGTVLGSAESDPITLVKFTGSAAGIPDKVTFSFDGANAGKLMGTTATMQYSVTGADGEWIDCTEDMTDLANVLDKITAEGDIRIKDLGNGTTTTESPIYTIIINKAPDLDEDDFEVIHCTTPANNDGAIRGLNSTIEWRKNHTGEWQPIGEGVTELPDLTPDIYCFRTKATGTTMASEFLHLSVEKSGEAPALEITVDSIAGGKIGLTWNLENALDAVDTTAGCILARYTAKNGVKTMEEAAIGTLSIDAGGKSGHITVDSSVDLSQPGWVIFLLDGQCKPIYIQLDVDEFRAKS